MDDFRRLGAMSQADVVAAAERAIFADTPSPPTLEERRENLDFHGPHWVEERLAPLDAQLGDETGLWPHARAYVEEHPDEFFRD